MRPWRGSPTPTGRKRAAELAYWRSRRVQDGELEAGVPHYEWEFTTNFGLGRDFYRGKRMLDIGCGPRGSLEWASEAAERVGLDPLAKHYAKLRSRPHAMSYASAPAEAIPFPDGYFDVVSAFNSLDHVESIEDALREMARVARPAGTLLLLVDINHEATINEPHTLGWSIVEDQLARDWDLVARRDLERPTENLRDNLGAALPFDHADGRERPGVLSARFRRKPPSRPD